MQPTYKKIKEDPFIYRLFFGRKFAEFGIIVKLNARLDCFSTCESYSLTGASVGSSPHQFGSASSSGGTQA